MTLNGGNSPAVSVSGSLKTADNYSGNIAISSSSNAILGSGGDVDLKTSGNISLSTTGTSPLVQTKTLSLEGDITLTAPNISASLLDVSGGISIKDIEGDLDISSASTGVAPIIYSKPNGTVTLSAPNGDIVISSAGTGSSAPIQAIYANNVIIEDSKSLQIQGNHMAQVINATNNITFKNCKSVSVQTDSAAALVASVILFENCDSVTVATESDKFAITGKIDFKGCKSVSVSTAGTRAIAGQYTCDGRLVITENGVTKMIENGTETEVGGDVTNTGLDLRDEEDVPDEKTVYAAGSGTITFIPAKGDNKAKLVLNNATIKKSETDPAIEISNDVDIELEGTNHLSVINGIASDGTIKISGNGELTVEAYFGAITAEEGVIVNNGTLVLSGQTGIYADKNITVEGGDITITPSENGYGLYTYEGDITINDGTLNISSDAEDACGICAEGETDNETGKISGGNVLIHGGTVNIAVEQEAIYAYDNVKIDSDAKVMATSTDEYDGIYAYKGNIDINGNAKVTATGGCDGIHVNEGNVNIGDSAEVIATDGEDGIFASEGNITIKDNAKVTAKSDDAAIYTNGALTIGGNAVVTADGAEGDVDVYAEEACTVADSAKLTALVQTGNDYTAYGICDSNNMDSIMPTKLEVKPGAEFTINAGTCVEIADLSALTLDGKLINNGKVVLRNVENPEETIKDMNLTGTGFVVGINNDQESYYANDGTVLKQTDYINLLDEETIPTGCAWDEATKTLTLKDIIVGQHITGKLKEDVTIKTEGYVIIDHMDNITSQSLTLTGDAVNVNDIVSEGNLVIEAKEAYIDSIHHANGTSKLTFRNTTAGVKTIDWPDISPDANKLTYGVELINSKVTVGGSANSQFFAGKIAMDDNSVLTLNNVPIKNYGNYPDGLDGLKPYLPTGYKIAQFVESETAADKPYTILDANNNIVYDITLKKAETTKPSGGSGGGGGSSTQYYNITVKSAENGTVEADKKTVAKDAVVTLTVKAAEGYQLDKLTVADSKNAAITLTDKGNGKYEFKMPAQAVTVTAAFAKTQTEPATTFTDVPENAWYQTAVDYVSGKGLMNGIGENKFGPTQLTDRGMLVTILWRMEGSPSSKQTAGFTDIKETDYFYAAVQWAAGNKIVNGTSATTFAPNDSVTREQLATILYRYATYKGYDVEQGGMAIREFDDYEKISEFAKTGTAWAVNTGIISGKGNQTLDPQGVATRAEIAAMLMRFCENIAK